MASANESCYRPALIVVDFQEDFCPPNGSLAVAGGRDIAVPINDLLQLPFVLRVATQDWHPADHISFASNHPAPNNKPFESVVEIKNPENSDEVQTTRLWPDHCIQDSPGAQLLPEFDQSKVHYFVKKGQDKRVEMYSAFKDPFKAPCVSESKLLHHLKGASISHVYVVGLATDYCVKATALHSAEEGFQTYIVSEATKAVDQSETALEATRDALEAKGVHFVNSAGIEVDRVRQFSER